jgi:hypothetical protein
MDNNVADVAGFQRAMQFNALAPFSGKLRLFARFGPTR